MITNVVPLGDNDRFLSFLPLSHIAERIVSHFGQIASGGETWFATSYATVATDMLGCHPTVFFAVPRVWEKIRVSFDLAIHDQSIPRRMLIRRFQHVGSRRLEALSGGSRPSVLADTEHRLLNATVGQSIRKKLGLNQARAMFSGAAPISPDLLRWLGGIGLNVGEVYGQTEVCGPTSITPLHEVRIGSVGKPVPGLEVRLAEDNEILVQGPNVCRGYFRNEAATAALFTTDGWMLTGDLGSLSADGYLRITGRKKDLMKTATGKYIAPQELELRLQSVRFVKHGVVVAEGRTFVSALLYLDEEELISWAKHRDKPTDLATLANDSDVVLEIQKGIEELNDGVSQAEHIRQWTVCPRELTVENGELTPTLKIIRARVMDHFSNDVERMYTKRTD